MRSRAVRLTLTLLVVAAIGTAGWYCWDAQNRITARTADAATFDSGLATATRHALDLRAAQQAYVAAGQNEAFWFEKVTSSAEALRTALTSLEAGASSDPARVAIGKAGRSLDEFEERDRRVRSYASSGQKLLASDVIFSDGLTTTEAILSAIDEAGTASHADRSAAVQAAVREQMMAAGSAAAFALLVLFVLTPAGARVTPEIPQARPEARPHDTLSLDLRPTVPRATRTAQASVAPPVVAAPVVAASPTPAPIGAIDARRELVRELQDVAALCTDLARLDDTSALPAILEKTAAALDASGLVLWFADQSRKELTPIIAHGYPASLLARMGTLSVDASNATAAAFRTGLLQTVEAGAGSSGAIAAPLVSPSGCLGVMSAELRNDGEHRPSRLAAAAIIAAQLAAIVGPPARADDRSTAAS